MAWHATRFVRELSVPRLKGKQAGSGREGKESEGKEREVSCPRPAGIRLQKGREQEMENDDEPSQPWEGTR